MSNFWPKKWSQSLKKCEWWSLTRELLKQYLSEKQNSFFQVVAYGSWSLTISGRYERVDCNKNLHFTKCFKDAKVHCNTNQTVQIEIVQVFELNKFILLH